MEIKEVIEQLKDKFGDTIDVAKIKESLSGIDLSKESLTDIIAKLQAKGMNLLGDLDGDGVVESPIEELKGKASKMFGGIFG